MITVEIYFTRGDVDDSFVVEANTDEELRQKTLEFFAVRGMTINDNYSWSREIKRPQ